MMIKVTIMIVSTIAGVLSQRDFANKENKYNLMSPSSVHAEGLHGLYPKGLSSYSFFGDKIAHDSKSKSFAVSSPGNGFQGSVYLYQIVSDHNNKTELELTNNIISPPVPVANNFGSSIALNSKSIFVGANLNQLPENNLAGCVYVYKNNKKPIKPAPQIPTQRLIATDSEESSFFGGSLKASENLVIIGASYNDYHGSAYIFKYNSETDSWQEDVKIQPSSKDIYSFGSVVEIEELETNDDPLDSSDDILEALAVVGGSFNEENIGSVFIYRRNNIGIWIEESILQAPLLFSSDCYRFGYSLVLSEGSLLISAKTKNSQGIVFSYERIVTKDRIFWKNTGSIQPSPGTTFFGAFLSMFRGMAIISAQGIYDPESGEVVVPGYVYLYSRSTNYAPWTETDKFISPGHTSSDRQNNSSILDSNSSSILDDDSLYFDLLLEDVPDDLGDRIMDFHLRKLSATNKSLDSVAYDNFGSSVLITEDYHTNKSLLFIGASLGNSEIDNTGIVYVKSINTQEYSILNYLDSTFTTNGSTEDMALFTAKSFGIFVGLILAVIIPSATIAGIIVYKYRNSVRSNNHYTKTEQNLGVESDEVELGIINNPINSNKALI